VSILNCFDCTYNKIGAECTHPKSSSRKYDENQYHCTFFKERKKANLTVVKCLECTYHEPADCKHPKNTPANFLNFWYRTGDKECNYFKKKNDVLVRQ